MQLKTGCKLSPKSRNKTWMSPSTPPYPPYPFVVFGFQYYSFKRIYFFCPLVSLHHQHTFFTPKFSKDFYFSFFLFLNGDEFTRKRKKQRAYLVGRKFFSPESLGFFLPRDSVHPVRDAPNKLKESGVDSFSNYPVHHSDLCGK